MTLQRPFHHALTVTSLEDTNHFYGEVLGFARGRQSPGFWTDFGMGMGGDDHQHQLSFHLHPEKTDNVIIKHKMHVPYFGMSCSLEKLTDIKARLLANGHSLVYEDTRDEGLPNEKRDLYFFDPSGNLVRMQGHHLESGMKSAFLYAAPIKDAAATAEFYARHYDSEVQIGRVHKGVLPINWAGNRLRFPVDPSYENITAQGKVDGGGVPIPHFGAVYYPMAAWNALASRLQAQGAKFEKEPHIRFEGQPGEQGVMFMLDPNGHAHEIKAYAQASDMLATEEPPAPVV